MEEFYSLGESDWQDFLERWKRLGVDFESCLEIGCGAGRLTKHIDKTFDKTYGLDISPGMIEFARKHISEVEFVCYDGNAIPLDSESITAVFSTHVFQHFDSISYAEHYFEHIAIILKPGGTFFIHLPVYCWPSDQRIFGAIYFFRKKLEALKSIILRNLMKLGLVKPIMRGLRFPAEYLFKQLPNYGFGRIEIVAFKTRSNDALHWCVWGKKCKER